ncbi:MAG: hypothetical protein M3454_09515 [Actinomycetota bacterium]|nr:hypothetical protein [Actinomycetota bacterium]
MHTWARCRAFFYPIGQLMDYGVHGWDVREGLRMAHFMDPDAADMLVPFMFVLWQATTDTSRLQGADLDVAVRAYRDETRAQLA